MTVFFSKKIFCFWLYFPKFWKQNDRRQGNIPGIPIKKQKKTRPLHKADNNHPALLTPLSTSAQCTWCHSVWSSLGRVPTLHFFSRYWLWTSVNEFSTAFGIEGCLDTLVTRISHLLYYLCDEAPAPSNDKVTLNWWLLQGLLKRRCLGHRTLNIIICQYWVL